MQIKYFIENTGDFPISVENRSGDIELVMLRPGEVCEIMPVEDVALKVIRENKMSNETIKGMLEQLLDEVQELKCMLSDHVEGHELVEEIELADDEFDSTDPDSIVEALQLGVYELTWNSSSGLKTMQITLDPDEVDDEDALTEALSENSGNEYLKVWSPDRGSWRSFWVSDIVDIVPVE